MSKNEVLAMLLRIMDKANKFALQRGADYEGLAVVYEKAVMKEIADLTQ